MHIANWPKSKQRALLAAILVVVTLSLVLLAEMAVRVRAYVQYGTFGAAGGIEQTYRVDDELKLRVPIPFAHFGSVRISAQGFRSPVVQMPKPSGTIRIAFLGGSTTFCAEVSDEAVAWPHLVTEAIRQRYPDVAFDYINAGVPGFSTSSAEQYLTKRVAKYQPDVIVIYEATNDLSANSYDVAEAQGLVVGRTEQNLSWPSRYSLLWYLVEKNLLVLRLQSETTQTSGRLSMNPDIMEAIVAPFRRDLASLIRSSQEVAPLVVVVTFAARIRAGQLPDEQRASAVTSLYYMPYMTTQGLIDAFAAYNDVITDTANSMSVLLIAGESDIPGDSEHYVDSVHFSDRGSRAMARRVATGLFDSERLESLVTDRSSVAHTP